MKPQSTVVNVPQVVLDSTDFYPKYQEPESVGLWDYFHIIRKWWLFIILIVGLFLGGGVFYTSRQQEVYRANAIISMNPPQSQRIGNIEVGQEANAYYFGEYYIKTQMAVFQSQSLAKKAIAKLSESERMTFFGSKPDEFSQKALIESIQVNRLPNTYLVEIVCTGPDPKFCATIANKVTEVFIEEHNKKSETSQNEVLNWLNKEIPQMKEKILKNRESLLKFQDENPDVLIVSGGKEGFQLDIIDRLRQELQNVNIQLLNSEMRYKKCQEIRKIGDVYSILTLDFFEENNIVQKLREQRLELENQLKENKIKYTEKHPKIVWIMDSIKALDERIKQEAMILIYRQEQSHLDLIAKRENLEKMLQEQQVKSRELKQRYIKYEFFNQDYESQQKIYNSLLDKVKELDITMSFRRENIQLINEAIPPSVPYKPNKAQNYMISCVLGLIVGIGLILLFENLDEGVKKLEDLQKAMPAQVLGCIPFISPKIFTNNPAKAVEEKENSPIAEAFRGISTSLFLQEKEAQKRCFVVSSALAKDGKTTTICNMSITIAKAGYKVLLIDGDLRKPKLKKIFQLDDRPGFSELLREQVSLRDTIHVLNPNLCCISSGKSPKDPYECISNSNLEGILDAMRQEYQYILIDTPPIGITSDALLIGKFTEGVLFIVSMQNTNKKMLQQLHNRILSLDIPLKGVIINDREGNVRSHGHYYDYYGYGYSYKSYRSYYHDTDKVSKPKEATRS